MAAYDGHICEINFRVRYAETDNMGLVHHAAYLVWFEEGRSAFIREKGESYADIEDSGYYLVAAELKARYLRACRYDQQVTVKTWVEEIQSRAITFGCDIADARSGEIAFSASLKLICVDSRGQITRIPEAWSPWLRG